MFLILGFNCSCWTYETHDLGETPQQLFSHWWWAGRPPHSGPQTLIKRVLNHGVPTVSWDQEHLGRHKSFFVSCGCPALLGCLEAVLFLAYCGPANCLGLSMQAQIAKIRSGLYSSPAAHMQHGFYIGCHWTTRTHSGVTWRRAFKTSVNTLFKASLTLNSDDMFPTCG